MEINPVLFLFLFALVQASHGFSIPTKDTSLLLQSRNKNNLMSLNAQNGIDNEDNKKEGFFGGLVDAFNNLDGIAEDFFYKRIQ